MSHSETGAEKTAAQKADEKRKNRARLAAAAALLLMLAAYEMFCEGWLYRALFASPGTAEIFSEREMRLLSDSADTILSRLLGFAAAALAALGSAYLFFKEDSTLMKAAALLGILSAPVLAMMPQIPRWGGFGAALSVLPVLFFCLWLVVFYKENAANPILWSYGMEILAIAMCLLAVFRLSAYLFYRAKPRRAIFACMLALITSLATLTDSVSLGARAVLGGWGIGTAVMCWIIINNFVPPAPEEDTY